MSAKGHNHLVIEERCDCGHLRSEHQPLHLEATRKSYSREGYGACSKRGCLCKRFRWAESIKVQRHA